MATRFRKRVFRKRALRSRRRSRTRRQRKIYVSRGGIRL